MEFNEVFQYIGDVGLYQFLQVVIAATVLTVNGMNNIASNFMTASMGHWCDIPRLRNFSHTTQKYVGIPHDESSGSPGTHQSCVMFDLDYDSFTDQDILSWNRSNIPNDTLTKDCQAWIYEQSQFISTVVSKYDLVCGKSWMVQLIPTIYMAGVLVGSLLAGALSDRFGRKKQIYIGLPCYFVVTLCQAFAPNYAVFVVLRFFVSTFNILAYMSCYVIVMELLGPRHFILMATFHHTFYSLALMIMAGVAYSIRDLEILIITCAIVIVGVFPAMWILPESPRWLIARGRYNEANKILKYIADVNKRVFPDDVKWTNQIQGSTESKDDQTNARKVTCSDICRSNILCTRLALVYFNWFTVSLVYFGVQYNASAFGDVFLNTFLYGVIEIPANALCWVGLAYGGRRWSNAGSLLVTGAFMLACIPVILVRPDMTGLLTALSTIGKGAVTFAFTTIYIYCSEMFPTTVRSLALGSASVFARVGSMASPYLGAELESFWKPLPSIIFGVLAVLTGCLVFLLPETKGQQGVPDTIEASERIARNLKARDGVKTKLKFTENYANHVNKAGGNSQINKGFMDDESFGLAGDDVMSESEFCPLSKFDTS